MAKHYNFRCSFCDTGFVNEDRYIKHHCKQMKRDEEIRTPVGMAALNYYKLWMTGKKRITPNAEQFLKSKLYTSFVKFAKFAVKAGIPNIEQYIKFMIRQDVDPVIWTNDAMYGNYLQYLDRGSDPYKQADATVVFIEKIADALECSTEEIFDLLTPTDVIVMLQQRRLSPWILLHSSKFREFLEKAPTDQRIQILSIVKPRAWAQRRKDNPKVVNIMKEIVRELKL